MLKICHIISGDLFAGAESMVLQLLQNLNTLNEIDTFIILFNDGILAEKLSDSNIAYEIIDEKKLSFREMIEKTRIILLKYKPQVIHSHNYKENLIAFISSRNMKIRRIATQHGLSEEYSGFMNIKNKTILKLNNFILKHFFYKTVLVSEELKKIFLTKFKFLESTITIIHNGIKIQPNKQKKLPDRITFGSAGRFVPIKNYSRFINIAYRLSKEGASISFQLIGEGPLESQLKQEVSDLGIEDIVKILPFSRDLSQFYKQLNVFVNTSNHEGIPISVLEAMSYGLPVIAPDVGGLPEIIDHTVDGFLVEEADPDKFAAYCSVLVNDLSLLGKMGQSARKKVEDKFSVKYMTQNYLKVYNS